MRVKGQRSSSAMGLISKTLRSISVSSILLLCFINDNVCTRLRDIQLHNIEEPYSPFNFLLVGSLIACTLSLYRGLANVTRGHWLPSVVQFRFYGGLCYPYPINFLYFGNLPFLIDTTSGLCTNLTCKR